MTMRFLVTGGAGFVGSQIVKQLTAAGIPTIVLDAFIRYYSVARPEAPLYQRYLDDRLKFDDELITLVRGDTRHKDYMRRIIMEHKPTHIIHLAALPIANMSNIFSEEAIESIFLSTVNLLEIARDVGFVERIIYASSSMVYGDFEQIPAPENHPKNPKNIYGGAKLAGEDIIRSFSQVYNIDYTIVRPSAVYGPTDVNRRVSQIFVENALLGKPLILKGPDSTVLDFTYLTDIATGFVLAATKPEGRNQIFNITCGNGRSLRDIANIIKDILPETELIEEGIDTSIPTRGALDINYAGELLGFEPKYQLEQGLPEYIDYVRKMMKEIGLL